MSILTDLLGVTCDAAKSVDWASMMVVLGIQINVCWARKLVTMVIQEAKALCWKGLLGAVLLEERLDPGPAAQVAGKLAFAVTAGAGRIGSICKAILRTGGRPACP